MTEHVDFELDWARGIDIGFKLVAINVSDIAAMGGRPLRAVATIHLGDETDHDLVEEIATGMAEAADLWGLGIVGGDIGRGAELSLSMTLLGDADGPPITRSGARVGDVVCVTGSLGAAHAGLLLLQVGSVDVANVHAEIASRSGADGLAVLAARQLRPEPRLQEGIALRSRATGMIDISDGLAIDLERLCIASNVGCDIDAASIPVHPEVGYATDAFDGFPDPLECALAGGEDFELLFTIPEADLDDAQDQLDEIGTGVSVIGTITERGRMLDGGPLEHWSERGWDHLRTR